MQCSVRLTVCSGVTVEAAAVGGAQSHRPEGPVGSRRPGWGFGASPFLVSSLSRLGRVLCSGRDMFPCRVLLLSTPLTPCVQSHEIYGHVIAVGRDGRPPGLPQRCLYLRARASSGVDGAFLAGPVAGARGAGQGTRLSETLPGKAAGRGHGRAPLCLLPVVLGNPVEHTCACLSTCGSAQGYQVREGPDDV